MKLSCKLSLLRSLELATFWYFALPFCPHPLPFIVYGCVSWGINNVIDRDLLLNSGEMTTVTVHFKFKFVLSWTHSWGVLLWYCLRMFLCCIAYSNSACRLLLGPVQLRHLLRTEVKPVSCKFTYCHARPKLSLLITENDLFSFARLFASSLLILVLLLKCRRVHRERMHSFHWRQVILFPRMEGTSTSMVMELLMNSSLSRILLCHVMAIFCGRNEVMFGEFIISPLLLSLIIQ